MSQLGEIRLKTAFKKWLNKTPKLFTHRKRTDFLSQCYFIHTPLRPRDTHSTLNTPLIIFAWNTWRGKLRTQANLTANKGNQLSVHRLLCPLSLSLQWPTREYGEPTGGSFFFSFSLFSGLRMGCKWHHRLSSWHCLAITHSPQQDESGKKKRVVTCHQCWLVLYPPVPKNKLEWFCFQFQFHTNWNLEQTQVWFLKKIKHYGLGFSSHSEDQTQFWLSQTRTDEYLSTFTISE